MDEDKFESLPPPIIVNRTKTLRDEFAMAAIPVILHVLLDEPLLDDMSIPSQVAKKSYELADAMLEARKNDKQKTP